MPTGSKATIDHDEIIEWAEERGAKPARVKGTGSRGDVGMIRLDFPGYSGEKSLETITWDQFFKKFDDSQLALVYRDTLASGGRSNFNKLVGRETIAVGQGSARKTALPRRRAKQQARAGSSRRGAAASGRTSARPVARKKAPSRSAKSAKAGRSSSGRSSSRSRRVAAG